MKGGDIMSDVLFLFDTCIIFFIGLSLGVLICDFDSPGFAIGMIFAVLCTGLYCHFYQKITESNIRILFSPLFILVSAFFSILSVALLVSLVIEVIKAIKAIYYNIIETIIKTIMYCRFKILKLMDNFNSFTDFYKHNSYSLYHYEYIIMYFGKGQYCESLVNFLIDATFDKNNFYSNYNKKYLSICTQLTASSYLKTIHKMCTKKEIREIIEGYNGRIIYNIEGHESPYGRWTEELKDTMYIGGGETVEVVHTIEHIDYDSGKTEFFYL